MSSSEPSQRSPQWSPTLKLVIGLTLVAVFAGLLLRFRNLIAPLLLVFILTYLLHPFVDRISQTTKLSWRGAVNLIYLLFIFLIVVFFTLVGAAVVQQFQILVVIVQGFVADLPDLAANLADQVIVVGPYTFELSQLESQVLSQLGLDFATLGQQALSLLQPALGRAGGLLGAVASSAASTLGWGAFILIISYFILAEAGRVPNLLQGIELPGYDYDLRRLGRELGRIWNAFMRGQILLFFLIVIVYFVLLSVLGVRNVLGLAFLFGLAKFIPYIGPLIAEVTTGLVAFFQDGNYLGLEELPFALLVVAATIVVDQVFDNLITPRIYGETLGVHPAAVLISALILASLIGLIGLLLAAPVLASLQLFVRYAMRKMVDLDPWPEPETVDEERLSLSLRARVLAFWVRVREFISRGKENAKE